MKNFIFSAILTGTVLSFSACSPGYVNEVPTYQESARPERPGNNHVWVDGNWIYSRRTHHYSRQKGYWAPPRGGRTYAPGHWSNSPKGHRWEKGRWK